MSIRHCAVFLTLLSATSGYVRRLSVVGVPRGGSFKSSHVDYEQSPFPPPSLPVKTCDDYLFVRRLGTGKFSDVFEAVDVELEAVTRASRNRVDPRTLVVVKCLKPVSERKIRREIAVLQHASSLPNLVRLLAMVWPPPSASPTDLPRMPSLVLEHAGQYSQWLCHGSDEFLSDYEIRYYLFHLLIALDALHHAGLMHRDVKPRNVLVNRRGRATYRPLMLIDLGLADFYQPGQAYNVRVASRHYKSPELLVGYEYYHTSLDLWGVGCMLAGLLLRREPFFRGKDNVDQLAKIVAVLGTEDLRRYLDRYQIPVSDEIASMIDKYPAARQNILAHRSEACPMPSADGLELLNQLLVYDHDARLTAAQAMEHRFFDAVRTRVRAEVQSYSTSAATK